MEILFLNDEDMVKAGVLDIGRCISSMEDTFKLLSAGDYRMGGPKANEHGIKVAFPDNPKFEGMPYNAPDRRFAAMPAYLGGRFHAFGVKTYGSNPQNRERSLPRSILMMQLLDVETGEPRAYMSANKLSLMRTGSVVGIGARYLKKDDCKTAAVIGPGAIGRCSLEAILHEANSIETIKVYGPNAVDVESFCLYFAGKYSSVEIRQCVSVNDACSDSDIVLFSNSNAANFDDNPKVNVNCIKPGSLIISTSSLITSNEYLSDTEKIKLVVDNYKMYEGWGEGKEYPTQRTVSSLFGMGIYDGVASGIITRDSVIDIGEIIDGRKIARDNENQVVFFAVGGMPTEDVAWATDCYNRAKELGIGTNLLLW